MIRTLIAVLAALVLAACTSRTGGQSESNDSVTLEFRKVLRTEPVDGKAQSRPAVSAPADQAAIDKAKAARQKIAISDRSAVTAALGELDCAAADPLQGQDDPNLPLITCDPALPAKYVLEPAFLTGADVESARAEPDQRTGRYVLAITFRAEGAKVWADFTTSNVDQQVAVVLDARVLSAPTIQEPILSPTTIVNGGSPGFTKQEAEDLARKLGSR